MDLTPVTATWQMWATMAIVAVAVYLYFRERFSIESISIGIIVVLLIFFHMFAPPSANLGSSALLSGFAAPALIAIMALLVVGQGLFHIRWYGSNQKIISHGLKLSISIQGKDQSISLNSILCL